MSGGECQLQELSYDEQLKFKERTVYNHLKRIGGLEHLYLPQEKRGGCRSTGRGDDGADHRDGKSMEIPE